MSYNAPQYLIKLAKRNSQPSKEHASASQPADEQKGLLEKQSLGSERGTSIQTEVLGVVPALHGQAKFVDATERTKERTCTFELQRTYTPQGVCEAIWF